MSDPLPCVLAKHGLGLHNSGRSYLCCQSRKYLQDANGNEIYMDTHSLEDAWHSPTRLEILSALESGVKHENCQACWDDEDAGKPSRRTINNEMFVDIKDITTQPQILDLKLGNTCNMKCRTCNPEVSSQWYREDWELNARPRENIQFVDYLKRWKRISASYNDDNQGLWQTLDKWIDKVIYIDYYGAEPMLIRKNFEVLEMAVKRGQASDMTLHINTNGTIWDDYHADLLKNFKHIMFDISVDDIKDRCGYIRYSSDWATVSKNIEDLQTFVDNNSGFHLCVCVTVNCYNIYYLDEIVDYFYQQKLNVNINMLHLPWHLNIKILPKEVKQAIVEKLSSHQLDPSIHQHRRTYWEQHRSMIIDFMMTTIEGSENHQRDLWYYTRGLDRSRSQSFESTLPEFAALMRPTFDQWDQTAGLSGLSDAAG